MSEVENGKRTADLSPEAQLALFEQLHKQKRTQSSLAPTHIVRQDRATRRFPLSFAQQRLWFLEQFEPGTALYNIPEAIIVSGQLDVAAMQHALDALVARHETLRTTFEAVDGSPMQVIADPQPVLFPVIDFRGVPETEAEPEALRLVHDEGARPFDLAHGPLLRAFLIRMGAQEHILLLTMHHIISDGWSKGVLMDELLTLYRAFVAGVTTSNDILPELPIQYADFAVWQRGWLQGDVLADQFTYWRHQLTDIPVLQLPTDRPRPVIQSIRGAATARQLSPELAARLLALSRAEKSTLFMVMLAAFDVVLSRYTGQEDIAVGTAIANRNRSDIERLIGFFVNTLVLRTDLSGNPTFRELLGRVRDVCLGAYAHQDLPFEQLVEEFQPKRDLSGNPLVQVTLTLQNAPAASAEIADVRLTPIIADIQTSKFDLTVYVVNQEDGLILDAEYKSDLFDEATISRMLGHLEMILTAAVANPDQPIATMPLLTESEQHQVLHEWNAIKETYPQTECLHQIFAQRAAATPDAIALACEGAQVTYGELNRRANQLARYLHARGVGPDVCVGLSVERSLDLMVGILGILKAGGAYVPLDPNYPRDRLAYILGDIGARVVVTQQPQLAQLPAANRVASGDTPLEYICLDTDWASIAAESDAELPNTSDPQNLAYVIFTSGSTGMPKGVLITHANVTRLFAATRAWFDFGPGDAWPLFHSYAFDVSVWEMWAALLHGGRLIIVPRLVARSPETFYDLLVNEQVTNLSQTPSAFRQIIQVEETLGLAKPLALRFVVFAGEALPLPSLRPWLQRHSDQFPKLINMYGITETTVHVTYRQITAADVALPNAPSVVGGAMLDLSLFVLDRHLQPVPIGVPGELYVGGAGLARGYLHRPDLTADRFIPHPFSSDPSARLYKSGDLARYLPNGDLEYLGRIDHQVKVRGFRIELGEIEAVLQTHPAVREAVVIVSDDQPNGADATGEEGDHKRLLAYVTRRQHTANATDGTAPEWSAEQVAHWQQVFDTIYRDPEDDTDLTFNRVGWNSSYTSQPIPDAEMHEWTDGVVARIRALRPRRVLEIGCGTGLLLFPLAPQCETYWGTDISPEVLDTLRKGVTERGLTGITLLERAGDDFSGPLAEQRGTFDVVVINSVVQYFPGVAYLLRVLEGAMEMVAPGGAIFVGDVRNFDLLETFHTSVQLRQAPLSLLNEQLRQRVQKRIAQENELVIAPAFFAALQQTHPAVTAVETQLKRGRGQNELTRFRYDVTLHIDRAVQAVADVPCVDWRDDHLTLAALHARLTEQQPAYLAVTHIPNARIGTDVRAVELLTRDQIGGSVGDLWQIVRDDASAAGIEPEDLWQMANEASYQASITWSDLPGCYDMHLIRRALLPADAAAPLPVLASAPIVVQAWQTYTTNPAQAESTGNLVPELRDHLKRRMPDYMIPSAIMVLDALPLNNNGKVDRKALPAPDGSRPDLKSAFVAPRTPAELALQAIWADVLGIEQIGIHDNFFELGGDSLMSIRVVSRAGKVGLMLTTKQIFQHQTIAELAAISATTQTLADQGIVVGPVYPMPPHRFILGPRMGDPTSHDLAYLLEGPEPLDPKYLEATARTLIEHHDALRLHAMERDGEWHLTIPDVDASPSTWQIDLSALSEVEQVTAAQQIIHDMTLYFDLAHEPLLRLGLCELGPGKATPLVVVGHSLMVDMQSWQFLMEDLQTVYHQLSRGETPKLPAKTTSFKQWNDRLREYAVSPQLLAELPYWLADERQRVHPLPKDFPDGENTGASLRMALDLLSLEDTAALMQAVARVEGLQVDAVLLAAVAQSVMEWSQQRLLLLTVEGHGRTTDFDDIDLSRTLGSVAMDFPMLLNFEGVTDPGATIAKAREELQHLAHRGISYNALRRLNPNATIAAQLAALPQPDIFFNYLATSVAPEVAEYTVSGPFNGHLYTIDETTLQPMPLLVTGYLADGQLQASWHYSANQYRAETMQHLAQRTMEYVRMLLAYLRAQGK